MSEEIVGRIIAGESDGVITLGMGLIVRAVTQADWNA